MDFTEIFNALKNASAYELYRLQAALKIEMENPEKLQAVRNAFAVGDQVTYFNGKKNAACRAVVLEKNAKSVVLKDLENDAVWQTPYYAINITDQDSDIRAHKTQKLTRNHFRLGELVGFIHEGRQHVGQIKKLNPKSASLVTQENKRWRVGYSLLFKILDGASESAATTHLPNHGMLFIENEVDD